MLNSDPQELWQVLKEIYPIPTRLRLLKHPSWGVWRRGLPSAPQCVCACARVCERERGPCACPPICSHVTRGRCCSRAALAGSRLGRAAEPPERPELAPLKRLLVFKERPRAQRDSGFRPWGAGTPVLCWGPPGGKALCLAPLPVGVCAGSSGIPWGPECRPRLLGGGGEARSSQLSRPGTAGCQLT